MWIEIIYALPEKQNILKIKFTPGMTALQALKQSDLLEQYPDWDLEKLNLGIFSEKINLDTPLNPGDRLEIYRPLIADPKVKRQQNVKPMGKWHNARTGCKTGVKKS